MVVGVVGVGVLLRLSWLLLMLRSIVVGVVLLVGVVRVCIVVGGCN